MGRRADPVRVAGAGVSGVAAAYAQMRRIGRDEALAEIADLLAPLQPVQRQGALVYAAAGYARPDDTCRWYVAAFDLVVEAGADPEAARAQAVRHPRSMSSPDQHHR